MFVNADADMIAFTGGCHIILEALYQGLSGLPLQFFLNRPARIDILLASADLDLVLRDWG